jgi:hypothetical protein
MCDSDQGGDNILFNGVDALVCHFHVDILLFYCYVTFHTQEINWNQ